MFLVYCAFGEISEVLRTITLGTYVSVQGTYVKTLPGGKIAVRVGKKVYEGVPVQKAA